MSISVYTGVMGSGKTFEAIKTAVLKAIEKGRRVVTNIAGLSSERCREYLVARGHKLAKLGDVVVVSNERVLEPNFFPSENVSPFRFEVPDFVPLKELHYYAQHFTLNTGKTFTKTNLQLMLPELLKLQKSGVDVGSCLVEACTREWKGFEAEWFRDRGTGVFAEIPESGPSVVQPGDLVVIDEAWRYWSDQQQLSPEHMNFFRMHRHYVDEDGVSCDLLVLIQDFGSLNRFLRGVCELVLVFYKMKSLGLMSRYRVEVYEGKPRRATLVSTSPWQKYDKTIFPLYKSYDGAGGNEKVTDDRQNLFRNRWFVGIMIFAIAAVIWGSTWFARYVNNLINGGDDLKRATGSAKSAAPGSRGDGGNVVAPVASAAASPKIEARLSAVVESFGGDSVVIYQTVDGRFVQQRMNGGILDGWQSTAMLDGRPVTFVFGGKGK